MCVCVCVFPQWHNIIDVDTDFREFFFLLTGTGDIRAQAGTEKGTNSQQSQFFFFMTLYIKNIIGHWLQNSWTLIFPPLFFLFFLPRGGRAARRAAAPHHLERVDFSRLWEAGMPFFSFFPLGLEWTNCLRLWEAGMFFWKKNALTPDVLFSIDFALYKRANKFYREQNLIFFFALYKDFALYKI